MANREDAACKSKENDIELSIFLEREITITNNNSK